MPFALRCFDRHAPVPTHDSGDRSERKERKGRRGLRSWWVSSLHGGEDRRTLTVRANENDHGGVRDRTPRASVVAFLRVQIDAAPIYTVLHAYAVS